ncbi:MAG: IS21 family transposase [Dehalococcoidia bacterium]
MAFKEVTRVEIKEIIRRWQDGSSIRAVARATGLSRTTAQKYIQAAEACGLSRGGPPPTEDQLLILVRMNIAGPRQVAIPTQGILAPWSDRIERWVQEDRMQLTRVHELLGQQGCAVSYTSLRRFVARQGLSRNKRTTVRMNDTAPGEAAEMDFGRLGLIWDAVSGRRRLAWAMVIVLKYSRHSFVWPMFRQRLDDVVEGLEAAWAFFGGIPKYLVIDNFPAAVAGPDSLLPRLTRGFLEYAQHRGFFPDPARPGHPKDKPVVERGVPYVRERFFKGGGFAGLDDLRLQARNWCLQTAGQRVHGTTRRLPLVVFRQEEQAVLLPWDGEPYDVPVWRSAKVHPDHHISCGYALYSVPYSSCAPGSSIEVRCDRKLVTLYYRGDMIKIHPRRSPGERSTDPADYPPERTAYTLRAPDRLRHQCAQLGTSVSAFADRLLGGPLPWAKIRQAQKLLRLGERYTPDRLDAACRRALEVDLIDVRRLERILAQALEAESLPTEVAMAPPPGRFARPGQVFAYQEVTA